MIIHSRIAKLRLTEIIALQNALANMYVKCGSVVDARNVFDEMLERNVFSWTVMIAAYVRHRFAEEALALFQQMAATCIQPNQFTFASVVSACAGLASVKQGAEIHEKVIISGFSDDVVVGNALIHMYAKLGSCHKARKIFDGMSELDLVSWNSIIAAYTGVGLMDKALKLFEEMPHRDIVSWNTMIAGYGQIGLVEEALELFHRMPWRDVVSWTALIAGYARNGLVVDALKLFRKMPQRNVVTWNAIIAGFAESGHDEESLKLFLQMQLAGMRVDTTSFVCTLPACANLAATRQGLEIHGKIVRTGSQFDLTVVNALIDMYAKCGSIGRAHKLFDKMHQLDDVSWTSMISGYAQNGLVDEALKLFKEMPQPSLVSWNALIAGVAQNGHPKKSLELFQEMQLSGVRPDAKALTSILQVCACLATVEHGMEIHGKVIRSEFQSDVFVMTALIDMYAQCGDIVKASKLFYQMHERDLFTWNIMISGYIQNDLTDEALKLFKELPQRNTVSWNTIIGGLTKNGCHDEALKLFQQMQLVGEWPDSKTLASILSTCASLAALEKGYAMHGCGKEAIQLFEQMKSSGIQPDHVTLVSVLSACSHAGLVDEAYQCFNYIDDHNIKPATEHYICMVDLLGRIGHLNEAQDFINNMPIKPDSVVWSCFLSACRLHNNIELGECIAEHLFELDLNDAAPYVLLSNIYAAAGRWDDIEKVRKMMKDRGIKKKPGSSWIDVNKKVHVFIQDKSHSQTLLQS
ncbi:pentatricopeptide repeat-containing protein At4g02750 isoform X2 [Cryptomeria japonica]|uniref:pentatricopeptide repeat-containing protein At4g02750 isoform X2 n=1 Tax=Cryptomeria japonica TaxID=3369 RepID=UPI0027DA805F|nr:pentatricopeptide repeat-containing protein At4g02750 isoform X2 [Cryptomeria japonica]